MSRMSQVCTRIVAILNNRDESCSNRLIVYILWLCDLGCEDSQTWEIDMSGFFGYIKRLIYQGFLVTVNRN